MLCGVRDERRLTAELVRLTDLGFECFPFFESDVGGKLTAFATEPITGDDREYFRKCQVLKLPEVENATV